MTPGQLALAYGVALVAMALLDGVWLGWLARDFYKAELGALMAETVRWGPAALFYLLYPLGLVFLALQPQPSSWFEAVLRCAVVGLVAYGTYDLSNLATLRGWSLRLCVVDIAWGTVASAMAGAVAYWVVVAAPARG
jgi:uncharacterized membrane protein